MSEILGVRVNHESYESLCEKVNGWVEDNNRQLPAFCCFTNPHSIVTCGSDREFFDATNQSDLTLADGSGVVLASRMLGQSVKNRVTGPTSMLRILEYGLSRGYRHYFYGSTEETLGKLSENLAERFPGVQICGTMSPPFRELSIDEQEHIAAEINATRPTILWVGLGAPKQEKWIVNNLERLHARACMGVGAAFDYHAGTVKWAPAWIRKLGLEWAFRFFQQPRRLLARNLNSFVFLVRVIGQRLGAPVRSP